MYSLSSHQLYRIVLCYLCRYYNAYAGSMIFVCIQCYINFITTECAGFHQHGDQITFNATLNNLPAAPEPPTTQYGITQLHLVQNTTHFTEEEDTDTDFVMVSDIDAVPALDNSIYSKQIS